MSGDKVWIDTTAVAGQSLADGYTGATLLAQSTESATDYVNAAGVQFTDIFSSAFMGTIPGSIGETSVLAILIGAAILLYTGIGSWRIMLSAAVGALVMGLIFNAFAVNPFMEVPAINAFSIWWICFWYCIYGYRSCYCITDQ